MNKAALGVEGARCGVRALRAVRAAGAKHSRRNNRPSLADDPPLLCLLQGVCPLNVGCGIFVLKSDGTRCGERLRQPGAVQQRLLTFTEDWVS
jgi:hypothetical protein